MGAPNMMLKHASMMLKNVPHFALAPLPRRAPMLRNGTSRCGYVPARVLDLVEVHRVTCHESRQCDGDPSQVPLASGCSLPAAKKLV